MYITIIRQKHSWYLLHMTRQQSLHKHITHLLITTALVDICGFVVEISFLKLIIRYLNKNLTHFFHSQLVSGNSKIFFD